MKHEVNLSIYNFHTDLTLESVKNNNINNIDIVENVINNVKVSKIDIDEESSKIINKKVGKYITIEFEDVTDIDNKENLISVLTKELNQFISVKKDDLVLIVGLGNDTSTPDSLGPMCIDNLVITNHIYELNMLDDNYYRVSAIKPSVSAKTGLETGDIISSIVNNIKPKLVIIVDSLASSSIDRLNKTIQITDTGINPGSGIGNKRKEISKDTLNTNVIAIGVPTVVSASNIVYDVLKDIVELDNNILDKINENSELVVTPTEIDYIISLLSDVISTSLNNVFSNKND